MRGVIGEGERGQFFEAVNFRYLGSATVTGKHSAGIGITLGNLTSGKKVYVSTQDELGIFYFSPEVGSRYQITVLEYKNVTGGYSAVLVGTPSNLVFDVDSAGVTCMPKLHWGADDKLGYYAKIEKDANSGLQADFLEKYKDSKWNSVVWSVGKWSR